MLRAEQEYLLGAGVILGVVDHLDPDSRDQLTVELMSDEGTTSSEIEGEHLDRASVQASIRRQLGISADPTDASRPGEQAMAELLIDVYQNWGEVLNEETLCAWHRTLMRGRRDLHHIGAYRTHPEPMQIVSQGIRGPVVHFEAPPSSRVSQEMRRFLDWFRRTGPSGSDVLPALTRAGIAHLYFECIHPFEDGNGRIGRAIAEKALAQSLGRPFLSSLAATLLVRRRAYYEMLARSNRQTEIDTWVAWFGGIALEAQQRTRAKVEFLVDPIRLLDRLRDALNERQLAGLHRMLREGPEGFKGGLSAGNYIRRRPLLRLRAVTSRTWSTREP